MSTSRSVLGHRSAAVDNATHSSQRNDIPNLPTTPYTPTKSPRHTNARPLVNFNNTQQQMITRSSRHTSFNQSNGTSNGSLHNNLTNQVNSIPPPSQVNPQLVSNQNNSTTTTAATTTTTTTTTNSQQDPNNFTNLYHLKILPRSPLPIEQLVSIFEKWLIQYKITREKLEQIRETNLEKMARLSNSTKSSISPVVIPTNESASIQALFTAPFFQSVLYTFRAIIAKNATHLTLEQLDIVIEIVLYGLHLSDTQIRHACCITLRETLQTTTFTTPSLNTQTHQQQSNPKTRSMIQQSVIGSVIKPLINARASLSYVVVYDDIEITLRLLSQHVHFALIPELSNLIQEQLQHVYTPQLLSYIRVLFYSFQSGRAALLTSGPESTTRFKQHDVNSILYIIAQLCTYQGVDGSYSKSMTQTSHIRAEVRLYGNALLHAVGSTFPLSKTLAGIQTIPYNYQVIIGDVCQKVLKEITNKRSVNDRPSDELLTKQLLYSVQTTSQPPDNFPTLSSYLSKHSYPNIDEGTGNQLLEKEQFSIVHTFVSLNLSHNTNNHNNNNNNNPNQQYSETFSHSLFDHKEKVLYIPYLLIGPPPNSPQRYSQNSLTHQQQSSNNQHDKTSTSINALNDKIESRMNRSTQSISLSEALNESRNSIISIESALESVSGYNLNRSVSLSSNSPHTSSGFTPGGMTGNNINTKIGHVHEVVKEVVPKPTTIGCFGTKNASNFPQLTSNVYSKIDAEADTIVSLYQGYKQNPTTLTMETFLKMTRGGHNISKTMFQLSSIQLKQVKDEFETGNANVHVKETKYMNDGRNGILPTQRSSSSSSSAKSMARTTPATTKRMLVDRDSYDVGSDDDDDDDDELFNNSFISPPQQHQYNLRSSDNGAGKKQRLG
jgi:hypothetical protein